MNVNVVTWSRVPAESSAAGRSPGALPMCGGVFGGSGGVGGIGQAEVANVAVHDADLAAEVVSGGGRDILLDFLEHRNRERNLRLDRTSGGSRVREDVKFVGCLDNFEKASESEGRRKRSEEQPQELLTPTPNSLLRLREVPEGGSPRSNKQEDEVLLVSIPSEREEKRALIVECDPEKEEEERSRAKRSDFEEELRRRLRQKDAEEAEKRRRRSQREGGTDIRIRIQDGNVLMRPIQSRPVAPSPPGGGPGCRRRPLLGRSLARCGSVVRIKVFFPPALDGEEERLLTLEDVMIKVEKASST